MDQSTARTHNRRVSPRRCAKNGTKVTCRKGSMGLGPNLAVRVIDIGEGGAKLVLKVPVQKGQEVEVGLLAPGAVREVLRTGFIAWVLQTPNGEYHVGISFDKRLEYRTVGDLGTMNLS